MFHQRFEKMFNIPSSGLKWMVNRNWTHFNLEDGGRTVLWNAGIQLPHYMVQQPRKIWILSSLQWKPHISHILMD